VTPEESPTTFDRPRESQLGAWGRRKARHSLPAPYWKSCSRQRRKRTKDRRAAAAELGRLPGAAGGARILAGAVPAGCMTAWLPPLPSGG